MHNCVFNFNLIFYKEKWKCNKIFIFKYTTIHLKQYNSTCFSELGLIRNRPGVIKTQTDSKITRLNETRCKHLFRAYPSVLEPRLKPFSSSHMMHCSEFCLDICYWSDAVKSNLILNWCSFLQVSSIIFLLIIRHFRAWCKLSSVFKLNSNIYRCVNQFTSVYDDMLRIEKIPPLQKKKKNGVSDNSRIHSKDSDNDQITIYI